MSAREWRERQQGNGREPAPPLPTGGPAHREPTDVDALEDLLHDTFGFESFRPHQRATSSPASPAPARRWSSRR